MSFKRIWTLVKAELLHGPKDIILVVAIVIPVLLSLFFNLAFGNIFTGRARLGIYDQGASQMPALLQAAGSISLKMYDSELVLKEAAGSGSVDMGVVLPADFDALAASGTVKLKAYIWGESLAKNRTLVPAVLAEAARQIAGYDVPVNIETVALGDKSSLPWSDRLLPLTVLMAVFWGGMMLPATSLINEKQHRTLEALAVSPATVGDIFSAKGIIGVVLAFVMGVLTLVISGALSSSAPALFLVLGLGAVMAAEIGLIAGAYVGDINTLFAVFKGGGLLLFGPAIVFMFPQIPAWVGYIFPTYYVVRPVVDTSVSGKGLADVALYVGVLAGLAALGLVLVAAVVKKLSMQALRLNA